uniref:Uncharacterized protein n=1 Tax=Cuerna arida TaxID=1464854 RepID=A0A1B6F205_9HEMI
MELKFLLCSLLTIKIIEAALLMADVYNLARECIKLKEVNGTEDDVNDILMGYLPDSKSGQCMLRCMETRAGILVNDTYSLRGTYTFFRSHFPENPYSNNMQRGARFCQKIVKKRSTKSMDRCQYAHMVAACIKRRIKYVPGCRAAFYNPFVWKNPLKKVTIKPVKKYFEVEKKHIPRLRFEVVTKPAKRYTLDNLQGVLNSSESREDGPMVWLPPRLRKGKIKKDRLTEKKKKDDSDEFSSDDEDSSWDVSSKTRRHQKKLFRI